MVGALRWPESASWFVREYDPAAGYLVCCAITMAMAPAKCWGAVAPFYVELESPQPPDGLPRAGALTANLRNEHLQYAITWYGLALVLVVMFAFWIRGRGRAADRP